jgi:hypothetical protein
LQVCLQERTELDADLRRFVELWPAVPVATRLVILAMVESAANLKNSTEG